MSEPATTAPVPSPIQPPPDFPVVWPNPDDARLFWRRDRMHFPGQIMPMEYTLNRLTIDGMRDGFNYMGIPMNTRALLINTYVYDADVPPAAPPDPAAMQAGMAQVEAKIKRKVGQLQELWDTEWLPEIQQHLAFWDSFDLKHATMPELIQHLDDTCEHHAQLWGLHFRIVLPAMAPVSLFADLYQDLFADENPFGPYALMEGFPNLTIEIGQALWRLSRRAQADPDVAAIITHTDPAQVRAALQQTAAGRAFDAELAAFLAHYGRRSDTWGITRPTWQEDPSSAIRTLADYIAQPDLDLERELAETAARREARLADVRRRLQGYPQPVVEQFEFLLKAAQIGTILHEDHNYWIDFAGSAAVHNVFMEFGRRLTEAGAIEQPTDVFYLTIDELRELASCLPMPVRHNLVTKRKAEYAHFATFEPPPVLGTPPPDAPPSSNPMEKGMIRFFGGPPPPQDTPGLIRGNPGSAGTVRGPAKIVRTLSEAGKLAPGDILVAVTTAPPWTPLFATVAAVVTDTGGVLSHCAVVAREYGVPAVVGTGSATALLHDGQLIEVDGVQGTIRILEEAG